MFVLGDAENDGRVRREATALQAHGYDVRIFALATRTHGPGHSSVGSVVVERLPAMSWPQRLLGAVPCRGVASAPGTSPASASRAVAVVRDLVLRVHRPTIVVSYTRLAASAAREWGPDVVHAHDLPTLPAAALVSRGQAPVIYDSHELWRRRNRRGQWRPLGRAVEALLERLLVRRAALVLTVCESIATWLDDRYRMQRPPVVVRNVVGARRAVDGPTVRELAGLSDERVLLYTGRMLEGRGLELAIRALTTLPEDVVFVLLGYGDASYVAGLRRLADRQGVADRVRMVGPVPADDVSSVASTADVAYVVVEPVCLSYRYALPSKLFEAIAAGVPVLGADLPEIRRVVTGHGVGVVFSPSSVAALRDAFERVLAAAPRHRAAAARARDVFVWEREQGRLLAAYSRVAAPRMERLSR